MARRAAPTSGVITGPMFSGKTTELIRKAEVRCAGGGSCLLIVHERDTRYTAGSEVCTHTGQRAQALRVRDLWDVPMGALENVDMVGVDEALFFPEVTEFSEFIVNDLRADFVATTVDRDHMRKPFPHVSELMAVSDWTLTLRAECRMCGSDAPFTAKIVPDSTVEKLGGSETYFACCRLCWMAHYGTGPRAASGHGGARGRTPAFETETVIKEK